MRTVALHLALLLATAPGCRHAASAAGLPQFPTASDLERLAARIGDTAGLLRSAGMQCVAREFGRFWLTHAAMPTPELETFVQARCGEPVGTLHVALRHSDGPGAAALTGPWRAETETMLGQLPRAGAAVGLGSGEQDGRLYVSRVT